MVKKIGKKTSIFFLVLLITIVSLQSFVVKAQDTGYLIRNFDVNVKVNKARAYEITETIQVEFLEQRQGIIRTLPLQGYSETYEIENISVEGAPFVKEFDENGELSLRIGQKGVFNRGLVTYVIKYTLAHYQDYYEDGDYIYLNLLGYDWDSNIEKFTAKISYPEEAELENLVLNSGYYGAIGNSLRVQTKTIENNIYVEKNDLRPFQGITVNIHLNEGTFSEAPQYIFPYTVKHINQKILLTKEKELHFIINSEIEVTAEQLAKYGKINVSYTPYSQENLRSKDKSIEVNLDGEKHKSNNSELSFILDKNGRYSIEAAYKLVLPMDLKIQNINILNINNIQGPFINAVMEFISEVPFEKPVFTVGREGDNPDYIMQSIVNDNQNAGIYFESNKTLYPGERLLFNVSVENKNFKRPTPLFVYTPILLGILAITISYIILQKKGRDIKLSPVVSLYPPEKLSAPEASYVLDEVVTLNNMTSILYNWANEGFIKISAQEEEETSKKKRKKKNEEVIIIKAQDIGEDRPNYEKVLFNQMFAKGKEGIVTGEDLKYNFYKDLENARSSINTKFTKGKQTLYKKNYGYMFLGFLLGLTPLVLLAYISYYLSQNMEQSIVALVAALMGYIYFFIIWGSKQKPLNFFLSLFSAIPFSIAIFNWRGNFALIPIEMSVAVVLTSIITALVTAFYPQRTRYGQRIIEEMLGFKKFIQVAEKDRLEALIDEDPSYFYNILPYAQVFGLTKTWMDKFQDITLQPPNWYDSSRPWSNVYAMVYLNQIQRSMVNFQRVATTIPQSAKSGSFSGSGGGGFSGGGFSGGGSGGGGGRSW